MRKFIFTLMLAIVSSVWTITEAENYRLPSLCDQWNILGIADLDGQEQYFSFTQRLTTDTIINSVRYAKLQQQNGIYLGALREDDRLNIYYIPDGTTHEYLLYAFNAKVGDTFENVWFGGKPSWFPNGCHVKITGIKETTPRTFELSIKYSRDGYEYPEWNDYVWIEGVGLLEGPCGKDCPLDCENDYGQAVLCAYKNGEQIYTSEYGEKFGCEYIAAQQATMWYGVEKVTFPSYIAESMGYSSYFETVNYYIDGDTVINETTYKAFRRGDGKFCAGIRESEDRQQVYIFPTGELMQDSWWERGEHLLYNFDVQIGDTVFAFDGSYSGIDNMGEDLSIQYRWIVRDVQTIDGRKHVLVEGGQLYDGLVEWIEGIGTKYILFENAYNDWDDCSHSTYALCAADDEGNILYSFDTSEFGEKFGCNYDEETPQYFPEGMKWTTVYWEANGAEVLYDTVTCVVQGSSLINGKTYRNIVRGNFIAPIRQEEKKIYVHLNDSDYILYDFGLKVGDAIPSYEWYDPEHGLYPFSESDHVIGIDTITLFDGRKAKEFFYEFRNPAIEYVGDIFFGVLNPLYNQQACTCLDQGQYTCCSLNNKPIFGSCGNMDNNENASDTIPLFIKDNPGSSTVEPVDPNEIVATINGNELSINEYTDKEITLTLSRSSSNGMSANRIVVHNAETFQDSVSVQITEAGIYTIQLTNPEWVYMIEGTFKYPKDYQAIEEIDAAVPTIRKVLRDGRLVLQIGNHIYTITGSQIQ